MHPKNAADTLYVMAFLKLVNVMPKAVMMGDMIGDINVLADPGHTTATVVHMYCLVWEQGLMSNGDIRKLLWASKHEGHGIYM